MSCFRTAKQAAVQAGEQDGGGYRLEFVRWDALSGRGWASVRSCAHPEWPPVTVAEDAMETRLRDAKAVAKVESISQPGPMDIAGGSLVHVVLADALVRMEMTGVAQSSGRLGDRILVRIAGSADGGEERLLEGVIRGAQWVEVLR